MVWKIVNNHQEIKSAKEQQNQNLTISFTGPNDTHTIKSNTVNIENQLKQHQSNLANKVTSTTQTKAKRVVANPNQPLEEGFEWTDEYYDPDKLDEPGYREKVMEHLRAKHYYESPQRQMPSFQESRSLLKQWKIDPNMENIVLVHDTAVEWHRNLYYAERESGPAAGPEAKERVAFMTDFKKKSIRGRFEDLFGIKEEAFMESFVKIKPDRPILGPKLKVDTGQRLMKIVE